MPIYQAGQEIEVQILAETFGVKAMNVCHFIMKATTPNPLTFRDQIRNQWCQTLRPLMSNRGQWFGIKSRVITVGQETSYVSEFFDVLTGGTISNLGYEGQSKLIIKKLNLPNLVQDGRIYVPFSFGGYLNGFFDGATLAKLDTAVAGMNAKFSASGNDPFLQEVVRHNTPAGFDLLSVQSYIYRPFLGIQRRRRKGYGD